MLYSKSPLPLENGVSSIFGLITILFNYFNESKIELTPFSSPLVGEGWGEGDAPAERSSALR